MPYLVVAIWLVLYLFLRKAKAWLFAYLVGVVGFALLAIYFLRGSIIEETVERFTAVSAHHLCNSIGIPTKVFFNAPGTLLVLIVYQQAGWTSIEIDIECSGVLEFTVFIALVLFFHGFSWRYKSFVLPTGLGLTFVMNVIRVLIIVATIHYGGKSAIYVAHTVVGRAIFFMMVIVLYWYVFTKKTIGLLRQKIMKG